LVGSPAVKGDGVDFAFDESQRAVAELAAEVLRRAGGRGAGQHYDEAAWKGLAQAGLLGLALPEELGGAGLGTVETGIVLAEVGRQAADVPALAALALGVLPVLARGTPTQREQVLPAVAAGEALLTAAVNEPGEALPVLPATTARPAGDTMSLSGRKIGVPYAAQAARLLVPARLPDGGAGVFLVAPDSPGVRCVHTAAAVAGQDPEYTVILDEVRVSDEDLLGADRTGGAVEALNAAAVAGACALADGVLAGALELTTAHVRTREQFGRPLAAFQAVAQQIADVYIAGRTLSLLARSTCWRLATGRDAAEELDVAAYWLAEELPSAMHICHHLHGGLGVDVDYPLHRYSSRARDLARFVGGVEARLTRLGARCSSN
jgi:alkylation response protein AidB-like acyl-CoA dehydrogenase